MSVSYGICGAAARRVFAIQSARGSPDWPSALISLSMSYSTRRIESVAPSIKRYDAKLTNNDLRQQTRARRALLDWLRRLACRNSAVLRSLRGGDERNITKSLADRFWADDGASGNYPSSPTKSSSRIRPPSRIGLPNADRKSTRLNSSHANISYAVFC